MNVSLKVKIFDSKGTRVLQVPKSTVTIGRASHCDIVLEDPSVNPEHTRAWLEGGRIWVQDLGSNSGTALNDIRLPALKPMLVRELDILRLGTSESTLGLEAILVRAPVVKPQVSAPAAGKEAVAAVADPKVTSAEVDKRREEAERLGREVADLRLQLQMAKLEKHSTDEMGHQLRNLQEEFQRVQTQKAKWEETLRKMEVEKVALRKNLEKELTDFKSTSLADLRKALTDDAAHQVAAVQRELKGVVEQKEKTALQLRQVEAERESLRKNLEREKTDFKNKHSREESQRKNLVEFEIQKFDAWKHETADEMSKNLHLITIQKVRSWATRPLSPDMMKEWEADLNHLCRRLLLDVNEPAPVHPALPPLQSALVAATGRHAVAAEAFNTSTNLTANPTTDGGDESREARRRARKRRQALEASGRRWRSLAFGSFVVVLIVLGFIYGSAYLKNRGARVLSSSSQLPDKAAVPQEPKIDKLHVFKPKQNKKYRASYTDNVLYLENYVAAEQNQDFRARWQSDLNHVAAKDWKIDKWSLAPVFMEEQSLIQDLDHLRSAIAADHEQDGIAKMRERETKFLKTLESTFKNRAGIDRFMKFKRGFYQRNQAFLTRAG